MRLLPELRAGSDAYPGPARQTRHAGFQQLEVDQLVIAQSDLHLVVNPVDQFVAVAGEEVEDVDLALLQVLIRVESGEEPFDLLSGGFVALATVVDEAGAQVV